jgi:hypothetical protein
LAFIAVASVWLTSVSFRVARWIGRLLGRHLSITPRAMMFCRWIVWSKPLVLLAGVSVIVAPISYINGWGIEDTVSRADWVLYGVGGLLSLLVGIGQGTAQRLGIPDDPRARLVYQMAMAAGEDLKDAGYTDEQISRTFNEANQQEMFELIGTLAGSRNLKARRTPQESRETVVSCASRYLGPPEAAGFQGAVAPAGG